MKFGKNPAEYCPQTRVPVARFRGGGRNSFINNKVSEGSLFSLIASLTSSLNAYIHAPDCEIVAG